MTQRYTVTGVKVKFGPGFVLDLHKDQAAPRSHLLEKLKSGHYRVLAPTEFKRGEELGIVAGEIPKTSAGFLKPVTGDAVDEDGIILPVTAVHRGFGKWDVIDAHDVSVNGQPLKKDEAQALADKINAGA